MWKLVCQFEERTYIEGVDEQVLRKISGPKSGGKDRRLEKIA
jgi:hypothetical protein